VDYLVFLHQASNPNGGHRTAQSRAPLYRGVARAVSRAPSTNAGASITSAYPAYICRICEGDRRDSNPHPPEPQSADTGFWALPGGA
jgi:hypothetical protein